MRELYVQYGCGLSAPAGWRSFDASPTLGLQRVPGLGALVRRKRQPFPDAVERGDIVRGLPLQPASCRGVFASHVLEHLALHDARAALQHTWQLLAPNGLFRLIVPDLRCYARRYLQSSDADAAHRFMEETCLGWQTRPRSLKGRLVELLGNSRHLWMWDRAALVQELARAGFVDVRDCVAGDSEDAHFREVEDPERFIDAVALQCRRGADGPPP